VGGEGGGGGARGHGKDVGGGGAGRVRRGEVSYTEAVASGMYRPLGQGDVDVAGLVGALRGAGYAGWYVLEQDTILNGEPSGEGPVGDVRASVAYLPGLTCASRGGAAPPVKGGGGAGGGEGAPSAGRGGSGKRQ